MMGEFKRSPSKVWWGNDSDLEWRTSSSSPGSQDSGFSDSEIHQNAENDETAKGTLAQRIPKNIFKDLSNNNELNLSSNYKEKLTPNKNSPILTVGTAKTEKGHASEPTKKNRYMKYSPKVSRSLFTRKTYSNELVTNQYSENDGEYTNTNTKHSSASVSTIDGNASSVSDNTSLSEESSIEDLKSAPNLHLENEYSFQNFLNKSAPPILENYSDDEGVTAFNESYSDSECESELEDLFDDLDVPKHTSTPKTDGGMSRTRKGNLHMNLLLKLGKERVPPTHIEDETDDKAVVLWFHESRYRYDPECMISLQCKSIAAELNEKVSFLANSLTNKLKEILLHSNHIEAEWQKINSEENSTISDTENLIGIIMHFLKTYNKDLHTNIAKQHDDLRTADKTKLSKTLSHLYSIWQSVQKDICTEIVKVLLSKLEYPVSEMDLKATVTGITMVALRSQPLVEEFVKHDAIPMLLIQCEKSEGSSLRTLILRALSTMCCITPAVRHFEKYSGIQLVTDILEEDSRPEPERSEAVTLLAQVTAPWIEDNYSIRGLPDYTKRLVKSLTKFLKTTKCCQNLLLCTAALSNLSAMDTHNCIKYILLQNTIQELLEAIQHRGNTSVYILEQIASLIANVSAVESSRTALIEMKAPAALLCFLQVRNVGENVEKRLQQKAMIALSRLCGDQRAAKQIVEIGGVNKLVKLCREKEERFNSDAVLVAALASLRKIVETCGKDVISYQDSQELIEPKLLDSFLAYANQNESYV
ncbi:hypothetical protein WA026_007459 [Henosepilachna vigintioctopunctata]|uniref:Protein inscuteable homologue C-terminal domain-containing protein n=1 Tax=Henosepilachna vigintioctopunctata TaxID=420089 RepID=A0AAW1UUT0_9CUCU